MHAVYVGPSMVPTHVDMQLNEWEARHFVTDYEGSLEGADVVLVFQADVPPTGLPVYDLALGGLLVVSEGHPTPVDIPVDNHFVPDQAVLAAAAVDVSTKHPDFEPVSQVADVIGQSNEALVVESTSEETISHEELVAWHKVNRLSWHALTDARLSYQARVLYGVITVYVNEDGITEVSNGELARSMRMHTRQLAPLLRELIDNSWISRVARPGHSSLTILQWAYAEFIELEKQMALEQTEDVDR